MWMVRAGRGGKWAGEFIARAIVGIGFEESGDVTAARSKAELIEAFGRCFPAMTVQQRDVAASQMWRFLNSFAVGDRIATYDPADRLYSLGKITGAPQYHADAEPGGIRISRAVAWEADVPRDVVSTASRNSLGAIMTLFLLPAAVEAELLRLACGQAAQVPALPAVQSISRTENGLTEEAPDPFAAIEERALERTKDRIVALGWDEMQDLVAALLRALGFRTAVSPAGPDRGRDIVASPDGFGFQHPRIVAEIKHRPGQRMDAPDVRAFLGGRHRDDRLLYVSTGGFTREARYEADRSPIPLTLMTLDDLARALVDAYDKLDEAGRRLLPLTRVYWPL